MKNIYNIIYYLLTGVALLLLYFSWAYLARRTMCHLQCIYLLCIYKNDLFPARSLVSVVSCLLWCLTCTNSLHPKPIHCTHSFSVILERHSDIPTRLLPLSVSRWSSVRLAREVARRNIWLTPTSTLLLGIIKNKRKTQRS